MAIGAYPLVTLAAARTLRDDAARLLRERRDPATQRKLKVQENVKASRTTFERIAREWHDNAKSQWAKIYADDILRRLERDVFPAIGSLPISQLTPPKVPEVLRSIEARGVIETAKRVRQRISAVFVYAIGQGLAETAPAEKLNAVLKPIRKGRRPAITEINRLRQMIKDAKEDFARPVTRLRFLALTAVRPHELRGARLDELEDLEGRRPLWRIPAARMKGDQNRKHELDGDHLVPLPSQALAVLRCLRPLTASCQLLFTMEPVGDGTPTATSGGISLRVRVAGSSHVVPQSVAIQSCPSLLRTAACWCRSKQHMILGIAPWPLDLQT